MFVQLFSGIIQLENCGVRNVTTRAQRDVIATDEAVRGMQCVMTKYDESIGNNVYSVIFRII